MMEAAYSLGQLVVIVFATVAATMIVIGSALRTYYEDRIDRADRTIEEYTVAAIEWMRKYEAEVRAHKITKSQLTKE